MNKADRTHSWRSKKGARILFWVMKGRLRIGNGLQQRVLKNYSVSERWRGWGKGHMADSDKTYVLSQHICFGRVWEKVGWIHPKAMPECVNFTQQIYRAETKVQRKGTTGEIGVCLDLPQPFPSMYTDGKCLMLVEAGGQCENKLRHDEGHMRNTTVNSDPNVMFFKDVIFKPSLHPIWCIQLWD